MPKATSAKKSTTKKVVTTKNTTPRKKVSDSVDTLTHMLTQFLKKVEGMITTPQVAGPAVVTTPAVTTVDVPDRGGNILTLGDMFNKAVREQETVKARNVTKRGKKGTAARARTTTKRKDLVQNRALATVDRTESYGGGYQLRLPEIPKQFWSPLTTALRTLKINWSVQEACWYINDLNPAVATGVQIMRLVRDAFNQGGINRVFSEMRLTPAS